MKKNIGFIFEVNNKIGGGHFWRCFNFARILKRKNNNIFFITNFLSNNYKKILFKEKIKSIQLSQLNNYQNLKKKIIKEKIEILITDYYNFNSKSKKNIKKILKKLVVIDDHVEKKHFCDIYINNNLLDSKSLKKIKTLNPNCKLLLGIKYFVLNNKLYKLNTKNTSRIKKIFIFFGTSDNSNLTLKILKYLKKFDNFKLDVIIGNMNKNKYKIEKYCKNLSNIKIFSSLTNNKLLNIMSKNNLAIGAGGVNLYERLFLGLPSIVITNADNQIVSSKYLSKRKVIEYLGEDKNFTRDKFEKSFRKILNFKKYKSLKSNVNSYFSSKKKKNLLSIKMNELLNVCCE